MRNPIWGPGVYFLLGQPSPPRSWLFQHVLVDVYRGCDWKKVLFSTGVDDVCRLVSTGYVQYRQRMSRLSHWHLPAQWRRYVVPTLSLCNLH